MSTYFFDEHRMPAAERAAYANGHDHQRMETLRLLGKLSSVSSREFFEFMRDILIRLDAAPSCIQQLDQIRVRYETMQDEIDSVRDDLASYEGGYRCQECEMLQNEIDSLKDELAQFGQP